MRAKSKRPTELSVSIIPSLADDTCVTSANGYWVRRSKIAAFLADGFLTGSPVFFDTAADTPLS